MPGRNGTGPAGRGRSAGRGTGRGNRPGAGADCVCLKCGNKVPHTPGVPCSSLQCPQCGYKMIRE
ncbi:MAG: hypothetical protein GF408_00695 [Candidatus Omnitrophica bacterium]|nr:hypothetical protein [Candidatus Omnitrophota bacterium]